MNIVLLYENIYKETADQELVDLIDVCLFSHNDKANGLPLGQILTTFLPNIYLLEIESHLPRYYRYFDCFVFPFRQDGADRILKEFRELIGKKGLAINEKKTKAVLGPELCDLLAVVEAV